MNYQVEVTEKTIAYQGFFRLERYRIRHEVFAGGWGPELVRERFERGHAVGVLPYDPVRDAVVLIEQFRIGALGSPGGPWLLEVVAGIIDEGEAMEDVARREAVEEAGCAIEALIPIVRFFGSPGGCSERVQLYCGRVDATGVDGIYGLPDEGEDIRVRTVGFDAAMALLESGRIDSATPIIALQWLALNRERVREQWLGG